MVESKLPLDEFKAYASIKGWVIHYGRMDYANLEGLVVPDKIHLFVLSQNFTANFTDFGVANNSCQCSLLLVKQGDIGVTHQVKYETNIKQLVFESNEMAVYLKNCGTWRPTAWSSISVLNKMDDTLDGLNINATLLGHV